MNIPDFTNFKENYIDKPQHKYFLDIPEYLESLFSHPKGAYLLLSYFYRKKRKFVTEYYAVFLNDLDQPLEIALLAKGAFKKVDFDDELLVNLAQEISATKIILSRSSHPKIDDFGISEKVKWHKFNLNLHNIELTDFWIFSNEPFFSLLKERP